MSGIFDGQIEANYRARSNNASMAGIQCGASFLCKACGNKRMAFGRKPMVKGYSKAGYKCAQCVASSAAQTADKEKPASQAGKPQRVLNPMEQF